MVFRKGQVALEFLMTYGWAMFIILLAVGALVYFGVLETEGIIPEKCEFGGQGLVCLDTPSIDGDSGQVLLLIKNNVGQDINLTSVDVTEDCILSTFQFCDRNLDCEPEGGSKVVSAGSDFAVNVTCSNSLTGRFRSDFTITYTNMEIDRVSYNLGQIRGNVG